MLVNEWVETLWKVLQVRPRTLHDYKRLYRRHLEPVIGNLDINSIDPAIIQTKLLSLPPQTSRHTLMLAKTIWREAETYGVVRGTILGRLKTPPIQIAPKKFLSWEEVETKDFQLVSSQPSLTQDTVELRDYENFG